MHMLEKERSAWRSEFEGQRILIWGYGREVAAADHVARTRR